MPKNNDNTLSSEDLLTLQVLEREMEAPFITEAYKYEIISRIKYLNAGCEERSEIRLIKELTKRS